ncbi:beta-ketoacyl synthase N-terminal-like domain-containing protein, partial [Acinetobacter baumannii]
KTRAGIVVGSGMGGMSVFTENAKTLVEKGPTRISPFFIPYIITNMCGAKLAIDLGFKGPNYSVSTACATSNHALICAANHIQAGQADIMLTGGV